MPSTTNMVIVGDRGDVGRSLEKEWVEKQVALGIVKGRLLRNIGAWRGERGVKTNADGFYSNSWRKIAGEKFRWHPAVEVLGPTPREKKPYNRGLKLVTEGLQGKEVLGKEQCALENNGQGGLRAMGGWKRKTETKG